MAPANSALAGVAVVELSGEIATRYCARLFARHGARVWRVADGAEPLDPLFAAWLDEDKARSPSADVALAELDGAAETHKLVIAGQTRAAAAAAETAVGGRQPLLTIDWFDPRGAYADWRANDPLIQAMNGIAFGFGTVEGPPTIPQGYAPQIVGGVTGFIAGLAAVMATNPPRRIETNIFEANLCFTETGAVAAAALGFEARRLGVNRYSPTWPSSLYRATDGWIGLTTLTYPQWVAFTDLIGRPDLAADPRFLTSLQRIMDGADEIDAICRDAIAKKPVAFWVENGDARRIPITPALAPRELSGHPHWGGRGSLAPVVSEARSRAEGPTSPWRFTFDGERKLRPRGGAAGPLAGVRVADFTMGWAGPLGARLLGDLGADVLKVESRERRDWWRGWDPSPDSDPPLYELPRNFMCVNRNKRGLDLDLAKPGDLAAARAIIAAADVVLDNQGPGVMEKLGLGPAAQRRLNPAAISLFMPPFGASGPLAGLRAYGSTVEQASGMPFVNGRAAWPPSMQHVAYGDPVAGLYAAAGALIALYGRERLGAAALELCQVECLFQLGAAGVIAETAAQAPSPRPGSRRADLSPCCAVRCAGDDFAWLTVAVDSDAAWRALAAVIGRPELAEPADLASRKAREDQLEAAVAAWAATQDHRAVAEALQAAGVPAAPVIPVHELFPDPHLQDCGYWAVQHRRYLGDHFVPATPFRYDGERPSMVRPAPTLGEHTEEVLAELGIVREPAVAAGGG